jgi:hypothetical protein
MTTLSDLQSVFTANISLLIDFINSSGKYRARAKELQRTPEQAAIYAKKGIGIKNSLHIDCLAIDISIDEMPGKIYLTDSEDYRFAGEYWESLHKLNRWGGNFSTRKDGNHFEMQKILT